MNSTKDIFNIIFKKIYLMMKELLLFSTLVSGISN